MQSEHRVCVSATDETHPFDALIVIATITCSGIIRFCSPGPLSHTLLEGGRSFFIIAANEQAAAQPVDPLQTAHGKQFLCCLADCIMQDPSRHRGISRLEVLAMLSYEFEHTIIEQGPVDGSPAKGIKQKRICACRK